ncbi:MAG: sulfatase-like hydrolase/transferase [Planctomycetales bacterium]|nr:sulfatase-like hydrolase/transferase [Planctomycetales bacterium]
MKNSCNFRSAWRALGFAAAFCYGGGALYAAGERPNVLVIMADDLGYSDISPFGGEMSTPNLQQMASDGVRFRDFYVTPRCSNTRAQLLSGLQSHQVGLPNLAGDGTRLPKNHILIPEALQASGYDTYMSGKWHMGATDNFGSIPNGHVRDPRVRGFDHYWGFTEGHSQDTFDQSNYRLLSDSVPERTYTSSSGNGQPGTFYQTDAITDYTIDFMNDHRQQNAAEGSDDPFFMYVAYGAPHFPLQARDEWVDPLVSRYMEGWDQLREDRLASMKAMGLIDPSVDLSPRGDVPGTGHGEATHEIRAWDSLPADRQADLARRMAIYSAMVERVDYNIGRILSDLEANGQLDNTIIVFASDNGADGEWHEYGFDAGETPRTGAALDSMGTTTNSVDDRIFYGTGWANVGAAPFRNYKHFTHEGGIHSPVIVQWNNGLDPSLEGQITDQVGDIRDLMPTILAAAGVEYPEQWTDLSGQTYSVLAEQGDSLLNFLETGQTTERELGWWHENNRAYRIGDWKIVSSNFTGTDGTLANQWELYDLAADPTEVNDLAEDPQQANRMAFMLAAYDRWAYQTNVSSTFTWSAADLDRDGALTAADVAAFVAGWRQVAAVGSDATFARGDVNLDGVTNLDDFALLRTAFELKGQSSLLNGVGATLQTPEPAALAQGVVFLVLGKLYWSLRANRP